MKHDDGDNTNRQLAEKIRELEALLDARDKPAAGAAPGRAANIPVLDEVVAPADEPDTETPDGNAPLPQEVEVLAERLEQKFSMELVEILRLLRGNLKGSIARELRSHLSGSDASGSKASVVGSGKKSKD